MPKNAGISLPQPDTWPSAGAFVRRCRGTSSNLMCEGTEGERQTQMERKRRDMVIKPQHTDGYPAQKVYRPGEFPWFEQRDLADALTGWDLNCVILALSYIFE